MYCHNCKREHAVPDLPGQICGWCDKRVEPFQQHHPTGAREGCIKMAIPDQRDGCHCMSCNEVSRINALAVATSLRSEISLDGSPHQRAERLAEKYGLSNAAVEEICTVIQSESTATLERSRKRTAVLEKLAQEFVERVDRGEIRSKYTYQRCKEALAGRTTMFDMEVSKTTANLRAEIERLEAKLKDAEESVTVLSASLIGAEGKARRFNAQICAIEEQKTKLRAQVAQLQAEVENGRDELQKTLTAVETEVAKVYSHITDGAISKCNTEAATVIAVSDDVCNRLMVDEVNAAVANVFLPLADFLRFATGRQMTLEFDPSFTTYRCVLTAMIAETPDGSTQCGGEVACGNGLAVSEAIREAFASINWHGSEAWNVPPAVLDPAPATAVPDSGDVDCPF